MNPAQQQSTQPIALFAAFSDGANDEREREQIRQVAETLGGEPRARELPRIYQRGILKRISLKHAAAVVSEPDPRQRVYETAACVCAADGRMTAKERKVLSGLATEWEMQPRYLSQVQQKAGNLDVNQIMTLVRGG